MNPLFPEDLLPLVSVSNISTTLTLNPDQLMGNEGKHSWNYNENFPNEFDPSDKDMKSSEKSYDFNFPIFAIDRTLVISIQENFLKISPIFSNVISQTLVQALPLNKEILILGTSDRVAVMRKISNEIDTLEPPEFVTGFIGSLITELNLHNAKYNFDAIIVPSEGPTGFEKLNLTIMQDLIDIFKNEWNYLNIDSKVYTEQCYRHWKLAGAAIGAQSGLYI
ncbi:Pba1p NDAI_0E04450 [Naumovozyma dairenensis CBS 421]|uniref:Proteasome assembly chaperone 2 n=1 Tax=Naumovozyma dairenensis (strain ATCC 10597 / BCRC 20456 / CBS 421 / NBRC 0211 / NRRL Y-12639) TaxID=1071378 RepID=G0WBZ2_NAUDC|nr:hypothetical protein NDAI_0E04450 [Naumovozyma dairenensis CBS 421]CCD25262.1 hypothetical protein NDAI_0E04450 [Naumovozyma dairenensis CBS 421]